MLQINQIQKKIISCNYKIFKEYVNICHESKIKQHELEKVQPKTLLFNVYIGLCPTNWKSWVYPNAQEIFVNS